MINSININSCPLLLALSKAMKLTATWPENQGHSFGKVYIVKNKRQGMHLKADTVHNKQVSDTIFQQLCITIR